MDNFKICAAMAPPRFFLEKSLRVKALGTKIYAITFFFYTKISIQGMC